MRVLFSPLIIEVISLVENVLITPQKWRWINKKLFKIVLKRMNVFIIRLAIFIIFTYIFDYRREIFAENICYILLVF